MPLTKTMLGVLRQMREAEDADELADAEIVCDGGACWLGSDKVSRRTVDALLRYVAISLEEMSRSVDRYTLNDTGRMLLEHPERADDLLCATLAGQPYQEGAA